MDATGTFWPDLLRLRHWVTVARGALTASHCCRPSPDQVKPRKRARHAKAIDHLGRLTQAAACYQQALSLFTELGNRYNQAEVLDRLGDTHHAAGDQRRAQEVWRQALAIFDDLNSPYADKVRGKVGDRGQPLTLAAAS